jgi:Flp pilus assembly protein TadG
MFHPRQFPSARESGRRGAVIPLLAFAIVAFIAMVGFAVDVSYMQLVRSELRAATDAAAKAGAADLRLSQNANSARAAAIRVAGLNKVAGQSFVISTSDIELGQSTLQVDGSWAFTPNATPYRAMRVNGRIGNGASTTAAGLFFGPALGVNTFSPQFSAVASHLDMEVYLCIDRSHSMCFDLSGTDWRYPAGIPTSPDEICYAPHSTNSRWAALASAVNVFLNECDLATTKPRVALVTWASTIGTSTYEYSMTRQTSPSITYDTTLNTNYASIRSAISARGTNVMLGGTNMGVGLNGAVTALQGPTVRPLAKKVVILMTDGQWNQGTNPYVYAQNAAAAGIVIHCVTFLPGTSQSAMEAIATVTGGTHYYASNAATLQAAFQKLARLLPITLTQ